MQDTDHESIAGRVGMSTDRLRELDPWPLRPGQKRKLAR
jgi:hypothetical protein